METLLIILIAIIVFVAVLGGIILYNAFSWGYVVFMFWGWFIEPTFHMLPEITYYQAIGLSLFINLFRSHKTESNKDETDEEKRNKIISFFVGPWIVLGVGYLLKSIIL